MWRPGEPGHVQGAGRAGLRGGGRVTGAVEAGHYMDCGREGGERRERRERVHVVERVDWAEGETGLS